MDKGSFGTNRDSGGVAAGLRTAGLLVAFVTVIAGVIIMFAGLRTRGGYDQINYHERAIRTFAEQLPDADLSDYMSATTPGYHLLVAGVSRLINGRDHAAASVYSGPDAPAILAKQRTSLQVIGLTMTLAWAAMVGWWVGRRAGKAWWGCVICLPLFSSLYVMQSAAWLLPDNAAWCCVTLVILLSLRRPTLLTLAGLGAVVFAGVWMRQIHLWSAGLVIATCWLGATVDRRVPGQPDDPLIVRPSELIPKDVRGWMLAMLLGAMAVIPAFIMMADFYRLWGGQLVPPSFVEWHNSGRVQPGTAAFMLTLMAVFTIPFAGFLWASFQRAVRSHRGALALAGCLGIAVSLIGPTSTTDLLGGRFGALWTLSAKLPVVADRAVFISIGAAAGAMCVVVWLLSMPRRARWIMLAALAGFAFAQSFNPQLWQRYHEPFALMWITIALGLALADGWIRTDRVWPLAGPLALCAVFLTLGYREIYHSPESADDGNRLGHIIAPGAILPKTPTEGGEAKPVDVDR